MSKYIDADKLKAEIERLKRSVELNREHYNNIPLESRNDLDAYYAQELILNSLIDTITSLQQEQLESSKGKFVFPNFLYARTVDNKTIDVSYVPQSLDAVEYIKNDPTEQLEVDLEKEYKTWWNSIAGKINVEHIMEWYMHETARHFYELGKNSK